MKDTDYYTTSTDEPSPDTVNDKTCQEFFQDTKFNCKDSTKMTEEELQFNLRQFLKPHKDPIEDNYYVIEPQYIPKTSNPYKRIIQLKSQLIQVKEDIDTSAKNFNDTSTILKDNDLTAYSSFAYNQIVTSKKTIDAFINYNLFNAPEKTDESDSDSNEEETDELSTIKEIKNRKDSSVGSENPGDKVYSAYERYNRLSDNLLSQVKQLENDLMTGEAKKSKIEYEILMNRVTEMEELNNRLVELEDRITNAEKTVGDWDLHKNFDNISKFLMNLVHYNEELLNNSEYEKRHNALKMINLLLSEFKSKNADRMQLAHDYAKIKECYQAYEILEEFKSVSHYIKIRLKAIKDVCNMSNQLKETLFLLEEKVKDNEKSYEQLTKDFNQTIKEFEILEVIMKDVNEVDTIMKSKIK